MTPPSQRSRVVIHRVRGADRRAVFTGSVAITWRERLRGLLGSSLMGTDEALVLSPCSSVHTFGMKYAIDVAYLDARGQVIKCIEHMAPRRFSGAWRGRIAVETGAGGLRRADVRVGDHLYWQPYFDAQQ